MANLAECEMRSTKLARFACPLGCMVAWGSVLAAELIDCCGGFWTGRASSSPECLFLGSPGSCWSPSVGDFSKAPLSFASEGTVGQTSLRRCLSSRAHPTGWCQNLGPLSPSSNWPGESTADDCWCGSAPRNPGRTAAEPDSGDSSMPH